MVLLEAATEVNDRLINADTAHAGKLDFFDLIDMRMLSGLIGEMFVDSLASREPRLRKNPNLDGYPDLCDVSNKKTDLPIEAYLDFPDGGLEVKNTFGTKTSGADLAPRQTRHRSIQKRLTWKAHHQFTNHLVALQTDYIDRTPQIVRGFFANDLTTEDWSTRAEPKPGSAMTSFCQTLSSAHRKLIEQTVFGRPSYLENS